MVKQVEFIGYSDRMAHVIYSDGYVARVYGQTVTQLRLKVISLRFLKSEYPNSNVIVYHARGYKGD